MEFKIRSHSRPRSKPAVTDSLQWRETQKAAPQRKNSMRSARPDLNVSEISPMNLRPTTWGPDEKASTIVNFTEESIKRVAANPITIIRGRTPRSSSRGLGLIDLD